MTEQYVSLAPFSDKEIFKLFTLRDKVRSGEVNENTLEVNRMKFGKYLFEQGKVNEGLAPTREIVVFRR